MCLLCRSVSLPNNHPNNCHTPLYDTRTVSGLGFTTRLCFHCPLIPKDAPPGSCPSQGPSIRPTKEKNRGHLGGSHPISVDATKTCGNVSIKPGWWYTYPSAKYEFVSSDYYSQYGKPVNLIPNGKDPMFHLPVSINALLPRWLHW